MSLNKNNSIVEEALLQMKSIEEAISENAKGILASTMKEEISELVRESLNGSRKKYLYEQPEADEDPEEDGDFENTEDGTEEIDVEVDDDDDDEIDLSDEGSEIATDNEDEMPPLDMTNASTQEVLKVFQAMGENDGIIIKKDGDYINFKDSNTNKDYLINLGGEMNNMANTNESVLYELVFEDHERPMSRRRMNPEMDEDAFGDDSEKGEYPESTMYELEIDEMDDMMGDKRPMSRRRMNPMDDMMGDFEEGDYHESMNHMDDMDEMMYEDYDDDEEGDYHESMGKRHMDDMDEMMYEDYDEEGDMIEGDMYGSFGNMRRKDFKGDQYLSDKDRFVGDEELYGIGDEELFGTEEYDDFESYSKKYPEDSDDSPSWFKGKQGKTMFDKYRETTGKPFKVKTRKSQMEDYDEEGDYTETAVYDEMPGETTESSRTYGNGRSHGKKGLPKLKTYSSHVRSESVREEMNLLTEKNEEYKKALNFFRNKLNEVAVFNSNLAYSTRLFTEHSTTKQEKINILRRFDNVESIKESKSLYKSIKNELDGDNSNKGIVTESIQRQVTKTPSNGSSSNLIESKTYENPQFMRMRDLMSKIK